MLIILWVEKWWRRGWEEEERRGEEEEMGGGEGYDKDCDHLGLTIKGEEWRGMRCGR